MLAQNAQQKGGITLDANLHKEGCSKKEGMHPERSRKTGRTSGKSSRCHSRRSSLDILAEEPLIINPHMVIADENEEESLLDRSFSDEENEENKLSSSYNECTTNDLAKSFKNHKFSRNEENDLSNSFVEDRESRRKKRSEDDTIMVHPRRSREHSLDERKSMKEDEVRIRKRSHSQLHSKGSSLNGSVNDLDKSNKYPSLPSSRRTSWTQRSWSRRSSLAGNEFFKMDDEMVPMTRNGTTYMMPKTIVHHVPIIPIMKSEFYEDYEIIKTYSLDSEDFKIYKTVEVFMYERLKSSISNICGQQRKDIQWKSRRGRLNEAICRILQGDDLSPEEFIKRLKEELSEDDMAKLNLYPEAWADMKEMLRNGYTINDILNKFMKSEEVLEELERRSINKLRERLLAMGDLTDEEMLELMHNEVSADARARLEELMKGGMSLKDAMEAIMNNTIEESSFSQKMKMLMGDKNLSEEELFKLLQEKLGSDSKKKMEEMLAAGYTMQEVNEHFMKNGKTQEEENKEFTNRMNKLMEGKDMSNEEILEMMKYELGDVDRAKMEEMLKSGCSMQEVIDHFMKRPTKPEESDFAKKMKKMMGDKNLSEEDVLDMLKKKLGKESCKKMEEMLKKGFSLTEVIEHFMEHGKTQDEEDKEFTIKMKALLDGKDMTPEEKLALLKENLSEKDKQKMEEMLKSGKSMQEVIDLFMNPENQKSELQKKMEKLLGDADLSEKDLLNLMKEEMGAESKEKMEEMLRQGYSMQEIIEHFMEHGKSQADEEKELSEKLHKLFDGEKTLTQAELFESLKKQLCGADKAKLEELLKEGFTKQEIIDFFMQRGEGNPVVSQFAQKMHGVMKGKTLTEEEIINFMKHFLNMAGRELLAEMISNGTPLQDVIDHFMKHGKERVESEFERKMIHIMKGRNLSQEQIVNLMMGYLDEEGKAKMTELLKSGMPTQDVINYMMETGVGRELTDLEKEIEELCEGKDLTQGELVKLMSEKLGTEWHKNRIEKMLQEGYTFLEIIDHLWMKGTLGKGTQAQMEEMLKQGYTIMEVMMFMMNNGRSQEEEDLLIAQSMQNLIGKENIGNKEILEAMADKLSDDDKKIMEEMLKNGSSLEEVMEHFTNKDKNPEEVDFAAKIQSMMGDKQLDEEDMCQLIKSQLGSQGQAEMEEMLKSGMSMKEVIEHFMEKGKTQEDEDKKFSEKMHELIGDRNDVSQSEILDIMKNDLNEEGKAKMEEMLKSGCTMQEVIDHFMNCEKTQAEENKNKMSEKLHDLIDGKNLSQPEILDLIKNELSAADKEKMEEMLKSGCSMQEVIDQFMNKSKPPEESEFTKKMKKLKGDKNMSQDELLEAMKGELGDKSRAEMEEMLKQGFTMEEVMNHFMEHGKTQEEEQKELAKKINSLIGDKNMSPNEIMDIMKNEMSDEDKAKMEKMLESGCTMQEVMDEFMNRGKSTDEKKNDLANKLHNLLDGQNLSETEMLNVIKGELSETDKKKMEEMLQQGYSMQDVINEFMNPKPTEENEITKKLKKLAGGKQLSEKEVFDMMKDELGDESQAKMEEMLKQGYTMEQINNYMMEHGKTKQEEKKEFSEKIRKKMEGKDMSETEILDMLRQELSEDQGAQINAMLRDGMSMQEVIDHFLKQNKEEVEPKPKKLTQEDKMQLLKGQLGSDGSEAQDILDKLGKEGFSLDQVIVDSFSNTRLKFPNEDPALANRNRDVSSMVSVDEKECIPYMHPAIRDCTFIIFFEKILDIVGNKGLTHYEIMDLIKFRIGGSYAQEFEKQRKNCNKLQEIIDYFLKKDEELREEARKLMILTLPKSMFVVRRILLRMSEEEVRNEISRDL